MNICQDDIEEVIYSERGESDGLFKKTNYVVCLMDIYIRNNTWDSDDSLNSGGT